MSRQWRPGDVAMVGGYIALRVRYSTYACPKTHEFDGDHWHRSDDWVIDKAPDDVRPLLVIDPEDAGAVERLETVLAEQHGWPVPHNEPRVGYMQAALRSLLTPPKPPEPQGLGAVVRDADGATWVRTHASGSPWHANLDPTDRNCTAVRKYADIDAVEVLSEGVQS